MDGDFNPRSREGSDVIIMFALVVFFISIHAPAKGATLGMIASNTGLIISIHAPAKGATGSKRYIVQGSGISIHAPAKGATSIISSCA